MAISLQCPGCGEPVVAQDSQRGQSVKCDTCWTSVPVPAGTAPSAAVAKPATRTLTPVSAVVKPATAKPIAVAKAVPVIAMPVVAMPLTAKPALKATLSKSKEKPRFRDREDEDEDEDDGDETPRKKGGMGLLIGLGAAAVILVAGCGGLGWYLVGQWTTVASSTPTDGGGAGKPRACY